MPTQIFLKNSLIVLLGFVLIFINTWTITFQLIELNEFNLLEINDLVLSFSFIFIGFIFFSHRFGEEKITQSLVLIFLFLMLYLILTEITISFYNKNNSLFNIICYWVLFFSGFALFQLFSQDAFRNFPWFPVISQIIIFTLGLFCLINRTLWSNNNLAFLQDFQLSYFQILSLIIYAFGMYVIIKKALDVKAKYIYLYNGIVIGTLFFLLFIIIGYTKFINENKTKYLILTQKSKDIEKIIKKKFKSHEKLFNLLYTDNQGKFYLKNLKMLEKIFPYIQGIKAFQLYNKDNLSHNSFNLTKNEIDLIFKYPNNFLFLRKNRENQNEMLFSISLKNSNETYVLLYNVKEFFESILPDFVINGFQINIEIGDMTIYHSSNDQKNNYFKDVLNYDFYIYNLPVSLSLRFSFQWSETFNFFFPYLIGLLGIVSSIVFGIAFYFYYLKDYYKIKARQADAIKNAFLMNISHEIRTPLNGIIGTSSLALNLNLNQKLERYIKIIYTSGKQLLEIINDILDVSKIESGNAVLNYSPESLHKLVKETLNNFISIANEKKINFLLYYPHLFVDKVMIDPLRFRQILSNLLSNAFKFTRSGTVLVDVSIKIKSDDMVILKISIEDTGIGILRKDFENIFQNFFQVDSSSTRKYGGNGLGLSLTRQLIKMLGGIIYLKSEIGKGTIFTIEIPSILISCRIDALHDKKLELLDQKKVLLFSENTRSRMVIQNYLQKFGIQFQYTYVIDEIFQILSEKEFIDFDIVIFDIEAEDDNELEIEIELINRNLIYKSTFIILTNTFTAKEEITSPLITRAIKPSSSYDFRDILVDSIKKASLVNVINSLKDRNI